MVNRTLILILILINVSCGSNYYRNVEGMARPLKNNFKVELEINNTNLPDTLSAYKLHSEWWGPFNFDYNIKKYYRLISEDDYYMEYRKSIPYLKFYRNGSFYLIYIPINKELNRDDFDPRKGTIGKYIVKNGHIETSHFWVVETKGKYVEGKAKVTGDTLHMIERITPKQIIHKVYIKEHIGEDFINWKATW